MAEEVNPYAVPQEQQPINFTGLPNGVAVTPRALTALLATRFWMIFAATTVTVLIAVNIYSVIGAWIPQVIATAIITLIYALIAFQLFHCGKTLKRFKLNQTSQNLDYVLLTQSTFWRTFGILACIMLVVFVAITLIAAASF